MFKNKKAMKKTYIIPEMETLELKTVGMLANSLPKADTEVTDEAEVLTRELMLLDF